MVDLVCLLSWKVETQMFKSLNDCIFSKKNGYKVLRSYYNYTWIEITDLYKCIENSDGSLLSYLSVKR